MTYDENLLAGVSSRRIDTAFLDYVRYTMVSPRTYKVHGLTARRHIYPVLMACWAAYLPGRLIYRAYDPRTDSFSLSQVFAATSPRIDPTTNII